MAERPMVDVVREWVDAVNDGRLRDDLVDPEVEMRNVREAPLPGPYRGRDGLREWLAAIADVAEGLRFDLDEIEQPPGREVLVSRVRLRGRARHTGIGIEFPFTTVTRFRAGRILSIVSFTDHDEALREAGI